MRWLYLRRFMKKYLLAGGLYGLKYTMYYYFQINRKRRESNMKSYCCLSNSGTQRVQRHMTIKVLGPDI